METQSNLNLFSVRNPLLSFQYVLFKKQKYIMQIIQIRMAFFSSTGQHSENNVCH